MSLDANANRFSGFADLYDAVRPVPPMVLADVISKYAGDRPRLVVDLGCGTGSVDPMGGRLVGGGGRCRAQRRHARCEPQR